MPAICSPAVLLQVGQVVTRHRQQVGFRTSASASACSTFRQPQTAAWVAYTGLNEVQSFPSLSLAPDLLARRRGAALPLSVASHLRPVRAHHGFRPLQYLPLVGPVTLPHAPLVVAIVVARTTVQLGAITILCSAIVVDSRARRQRRVHRPVPHAAVDPQARALQHTNHVLAPAQLVQLGLLARPPVSQKQAGVGAKGLATVGVAGPRAQHVRALPSVAIVLPSVAVQILLLVHEALGTQHVAPILALFLFLPLVLLPGFLCRVLRVLTRSIWLWFVRR